MKKLINPNFQIIQFAETQEETGIDCSDGLNRWTDAIYQNCKPTEQTTTPDIPDKYKKIVSVDDTYFEVQEMTAAEKLEVDERLKAAKWAEIDGQVKNLLSKSDATGQPDFASSNIIDSDDLAEVRTWRQQLRNVHSDYTDPFSTAITDLLNPDNVAIADETVKSIFVKLF